MKTIEEKLRLTLNSKNALLSILKEKGLNPTGVLSTYPDLIQELDNEEQTTYVLTNEAGTEKVYAILSDKQAIELTATANDIRENTTAVTNTGYTEGRKNIPSYHSRYGITSANAGTEAIISIPYHDYKNIMITISPFYNSISESVAVNYASVYDSIYEAKTRTKISDITRDSVNNRIMLGITVNELSVIRYFVVRDEV